MSAAPPPEDEETRRERGRKIADALRADFQTRGDPFGWFEACYSRAQGDPALVPWGHAVARAELLEWLEQLSPDRRKGRALDIACGLGDNAAALQRAGFDVTAFDISQTGTRWAQERFPELGIDWQVANLIKPPKAWFGAYDFVHETYTLQALRPPFREQAIKMLPEFLAPGGTLLVIARGRHADEPENPPPWPLLRDELVSLNEAGLEEMAFEDFISYRKDRALRHFRVEYRRV